ncbi:MAG: glycosyl transferase [Bacteroidetes bacterium HGW-Bacteroidetes-14]|nr:MAG: glycosyl transferase [Bacteroidetes bacterium HGW-Bacteroidetes-14]
MKLIEILFWSFAAIVFYTYIGYGIVLFILVKVKALFIKQSLITKQVESALPEISLLIPAYNEESVVEEKMQNSLALNYPPDKLKILWITDGTNDSTNDILKNGYPQVTVLYESKRAGKTAAINRAIPYINSPFVVFTDANTMLNRDAILEIAHAFKNPDVGCVAGEKRIMVNEKDGAASGGEGIYWKYESFLKKLDSQLNTAVGAAGELFAIRTHLFEEMEVDTLLDDFMLSMRIVLKGYKIEYCSKAYAIEGGSASINEERKRKVRISAGGIQSIIRLGKLLNFVKYPIISFQYVSHRVLRWSITPVCLFVLLPLNAALVFVDSGLFYTITMSLQVVFYTAASLGKYYSDRQIKSKLFYVPFYFLFMNYNVIQGFIYYLRKSKGDGTWEKAKRA